MKKIIPIIILFIFTACNTTGFSPERDTVIRWEEEEVSVSAAQESEYAENPQSLNTEKQNNENKLSEDDGNLGRVVYITDKGTKYHKDGCSSLSKSKNEIKYEDAIAEGYGACSKCKP